MNKSIIGALVVLLILIGAAVYMNTNQIDDPQSNSNLESLNTDNDTVDAEDSSDDTIEQSRDEDTATESGAHDILITSSGFEPNTLNIKKGDTVTFTNNSGAAAWPASGPHPVHTNYPEFDPKQGIAVGSTWSFTFDQTGEWGFHDHLKPSVFGKITVTE